MINKKVVIIISGVILTIAVLWVAATRYFFGGSASIGIIGGSDGPTTIYLSQTPVTQFPVFPLVAAVTLLVVLFVRKRNEG